MPTKKYRACGLLMLNLLLSVITIAQSVRNDLMISNFLLYKDGALFINNAFVNEQKKDTNLLNDPHRPKSIYTYYVYGSHTTLCFTPFTPDFKLTNSEAINPRFRESEQVSFNPANLLIRIRKNGTNVQGWKPVDQAPTSIDGFINYRPKGKRRAIFLLANDSLRIDDVLLIDGKLKTDTTLLFTYCIRRIARPMRPRLLAWSHDWQGAESRISPQMINRHIVNRGFVEGKLENGELNGGDGATFNNWRIAPTSSFIFYFGKADPSFADSTMEYRILGGRYKDSTWSKTGHLIMMDGLTGNEQYSLEVRYTHYPENAQLYTFITTPYWYQRSWFKWITGSALLLLVLLLIVAGYRRKLAIEKAKKTALADRLRNMQSQLNPHFIFNALGSIQALMSKQQNDKAHQYLSTFGSLLRNVLTNSNKDNTTLDQEIRSLTTYLELEQLRFGFQYTLIVAADIQATTVTLPVMLLQPLVENAIRHGLETLEGNGFIRLTFSKEQQHLLVAIEDNGKGFDTTQPTSGLGLKLVKEKIQLINTLQPQQPILFQLQSGNKGTVIHLTFKNWLA
jgi:hypothetical protein